MPKAYERTRAAVLGLRNEAWEHSIHPDGKRIAFTAEYGQGGGYGSWRTSCHQLQQGSE
jgi:hypothetical protein